MSPSPLVPCTFYWFMYPLVPCTGSCTQLKEGEAERTWQQIPPFAFIASVRVCGSVSQSYRQRVGGWRCLQSSTIQYYTTVGMEVPAVVYNTVLHYSGGGGTCCSRLPSSPGPASRPRLQTRSPLSATFTRAHRGPPWTYCLRGEERGSD